MKRSLGGLLLVVLGACGGEPEPPQHVLFVVIDTLRADHLSCMGYPRETSPTIDALAARGALFESAISQASFTSPSMVSLMTGRYIAKERLDIPAELPTLAESFARAGWATAGFRSNPILKPEYGFERGFERYRELAEHGDEREVEAWFDGVKAKRSFTYVHITEPHDPYLAPEGQRRWREAKDLLPGDRADYLPRVAAELGLADPQGGIERIKEEIGGYDDEVRSADARVGRFLAAFEKAGLLAQGLVVIAADHGEGLWEKVALLNGQRGQALRRGETPNLLNTLMPTHGNQVHRELVHVPIVLAGPRIPAGKRVKSPVENVDLFPTLLELCDLPTPGGLQGESLLRHLDGSRARKQTAFSFTRFNTTVLDADGWSLILPTAEGECGEQLQIELFHLREDPHQRRNVAAQHPEVVERLRKLAQERLSSGIHGTMKVDDAGLAALAGLGYVDQVERENDRREMEALASPELIAKWMNMAAPCQRRLLAAEILATRALDEATRSALEKHRPFETSRAVLELLDRALAR
jgi:arylsulfatase